MTPHKYLSERIDRLEWSVRTEKTLRDHGIVYVRDLVRLTEAEILRWPETGLKSVREMKEVLAKLDLRLDMALPAFDPDPQEPGPYGIGSDHWSGIGKAVEEMNELGLVFGKLFGSNGARNHWSGDLVLMMRDEIADVRAALDFLEEKNPALLAPPHANWMNAVEYMERRREWKLELFRSWHRGDPAEQWPKPEHYHLPPRA